MTATPHLVVTLALSTLAVPPLARARWVWRSPRTGILLWQMVLATWVLSVAGAALAIGLAPYGRNIPAAVGAWLGGARPAGFTAAHVLVLALGFLATAGVLAVVVASWVRVVRVRRRHRAMLSLVAREDAGLPGVLIVDHPLAVAYCLPGLRPRVVLSSGALSVLSPREVAAVLAHERAHARERHDLVLLPFTALRRIPVVARAADAVALLVEMRADEGACRSAGAGSLVHALRRFSHGAPPGALGAGDGAMAARLSRLSRGVAPLPLWVRWVVLVAGVTLVSTPLSFLAI
jgi:Zn-dependent protease with chaperone function